MKLLSIIQVISIWSVVLSEAIEVQSSAKKESPKWESDTPLPASRRIQESPSSFFGRPINFVKNIWFATTSIFDCNAEDPTQAPGNGLTPNPTPAVPKATPAPTPNSATESTKGPTPVPTAAPTASPYKYLGCWNEEDAPNRAMDAYPGSGYNIETCNEYCLERAYPYAGVQFFNQCACGYRFDANGPAPENECNTKCTVGGEGICGGVWRIGVYATGFPAPPTPAPSVPPAPPVTPAPTVTPVEYLGCWKEAEVRAMDAYPGSNFSIESCISYCKDLNFPFAALQFFSQCACGKTYDTHGPAPESECNTPCNLGDGTCGGIWRMSVWTTGIAAPPTPAPTSAPLTSNASPSPDPSSFNIALGLQGVIDDAFFQNAVSTWGKVIKGDLEDFEYNLGTSSSCGPWPTKIDDVYICGKYTGIDGPGGVLASAGPRHYRPASGLPITGEMKFDLADVGRDDMLEIILHEMGHVLGIGPLWKINGLIQEFAVPCPYKIDSAATREYQALSGCSGPIPVEMSYPSGGSNCGHWQESCMGTEIMTPAASGDLPISRLTIAGLEDLGYSVDYSAAQGFDASMMSASCRCNNRLRHRLQEGESPASENDRENAYDEPRRLSEEGWQLARDYGKAVLAENQESMNLIEGDGGPPDLGAEIIYVMYEENGVVHSIMVRDSD